MLIAGAVLAALLWPKVAQSTEQPIVGPASTDIASYILPGPPTPQVIEIKVGESLAQEQERKRLEQLNKEGKATAEEKAENREIARALTIDFFGEAEWLAMDKLIMAESGYNHRAKNPSSGACGLPQSLPCSKLNSFGDDSLFAREAQILWMIIYISGRPDYGTPSNAWAAHLKKGWY